MILQRTVIDSRDGESAHLSSAKAGGSFGSQPDRIDPAIWAVASLLILWATPIGFVSGDGIAHSARFADGSWTWNPNHLLFEPIGALWQNLTASLGMARSDPDRLKLLSITAGALSAGFFRASVSGPLAATRFFANLGTAWFVFSSAFLRLWISDEVHMLQMPFLVLAAAAAVRYASERSWRWSAASGLAFGIASLVMISNVAIVVMIAAGIGLIGILRRRWELMKHAAGLVGTAAVTSIGGLALAWRYATSGAVGFPEWVFSYGGGGDGNRLLAGYGTELSLPGLPVVAARAVYGAVSAVVDISPAYAVVRDGTAWNVAAALSLVATALALGCLLSMLLRVVRVRNQSLEHLLTVVIIVGWGVGILAFGMYWNNSDDQFFFQLAVPVGMLVAMHRPWNGRLPTLAAIGSLALFWNLQDFSRNYVLYPRDERIAMLENSTRDAGLIIIPGWDEVDHLFYFVDIEGSPQRISIAEIAAQAEPEEGFAGLSNLISTTLDVGERVDIVSVFDVSSSQNPWSFLRAAGYSRERVEEEIARFPVEERSRQVGPFTIRSIIP